MRLILDVFGCLRPRQWTKNVLIFAALVFSRHAFEQWHLLRTSAAFLLFSLVAGSLYIFNDIMDIERDRAHPVKRLRPIPAGRVAPATAAAAAAMLLTGTLALSWLLDLRFGLVLSIYAVVQVLYTVRLKHLVILDVFIVAAGFVLRVIAGAVVIDVAISNWILICTMLLALFLVLAKRRHELTHLEGDAENHRLILREYSPYLLDQMIGVVTAATVVTYMIYTLDGDTVAKFGPHGLIFTTPFVLYGIFRYLYLIHQKHEGGQPEELLLTDLPLQLAILGYVFAALAAIYM